MTSTLLSMATPFSGEVTTILSVLRLRTTTTRRLQQIENWRTSTTTISRQCSTKQSPNHGCCVPYDVSLDVSDSHYEPDQATRRNYGLGTDGRPGTLGFPVGPERISPAEKPD